MFRNIVAQTALTTPAANQYFSNCVSIFGDFWRSSDVTFLSTLRALVAPRMKSTDCLSVWFRNLPYEAYEDVNSPVSTISGAFHQIINEVVEGSICVFNLSSSDDETSAKRFEVIENNFTKVFKTWERIEKVTDFFRKNFRSICFVDPEHKRVVIVVERLNTQRMHYLQCAILAFLPWYFNPDDGVSKDEMQLIQSLSQRTSEEYEKCIAKIAEGYDFRASEIRRLLTKFELSYLQARRNALCREINSINSEIDNYYSNITRELIMKRDKETMLLGIEMKVNSGVENTELMEYFLCNKNLCLENASSGSMSFVVKTHAELFDEDMAKQIIDNEKSYVYFPDYTAHENIISPEDIKRLMYAIFVDQSLQLKMCAFFEIDLNSCKIYAPPDHRYGPEYAEYMYNPHIQHYGCLGSYVSAIVTALRSNDVVGAVAQCVASAKSLNFADSTVMRRFMEHLYGLDERPRNYIELPNGLSVSPSEAIQWLKQEEANEQAN